MRSAKDPITTRGNSYAKVMLQVISLEVIGFEVDMINALRSE